MSLLPFNSLILLLIWSLVSYGTREVNEPKAEALQANPRMPVNPAISFNAPLSNVNLPVFPERTDAVYFVVAVTGGAKSWGRALARTIIDMGESFSDPQGPPLRPIYVDLPASGRFSSKVLTALCEQIEGIPISGIIVVGDGQAARSIVLSGNGMKLPVLWAKGGTAQLYAGESETRNYLQATLQPSAKEILEAIRAIFLQTHWHSFFVLSDIGSAMILGGSLGNILKKSPLLPTIFPLSSNKDDVFRQLAKISRSTRGIVLLLCDLNDARRVMSEAQRLKMTGGHFIWIWADTSSTAEFFEHSDLYEKDQTKVNFEQQLGQINLRAPKYGETSSTRQYFQQPYGGGGGGGGKRQNNTRQKTSNNPNLFHHIIGLRKPGDELSGDEGIPALMPEKTFFVPIKEKRNDGKSQRGGFNGFDFDLPNRRNQDESVEDKSGYDFDDSTNMNYDYDKTNPFLARNEDDTTSSTSSSSSTTRKNFIMSPDVSTTSAKPKDKSTKNTPNVNRNINSNKNILSSLPDQAPKASFFDDIDDLDLEEYNDANDADLKAKRANSLPSSFNISSHVFFHHFKDFPVGLLALRHIKMNVDRVFVRSAVRLFASTWSRVEKDEILRMSGKMSSSGRKTNWYDNWNDYDYEDVVYKTNKNNKQNRKQKTKSNVNVNSRHNNARGSRKYRRDVNDVLDTTTSSITTKTNSNLVNSSDKFYESNQISNLTHIEHLSDLKLHASDEQGIISNNENNITNFNVSKEDEKRTKEVVTSLNIDGKINVNKRQNGFWSSANRGKVTSSPMNDKTKSTSSRLGTPQYIGGCYGIPSRSDVKRSELFARYLKESVNLALSGRNMPGGQVLEKPLVSNFELLNLVPSFDQQQRRQRERMKKDGTESTKWRRVGLVLGRKVHLDTIVWPGGDIVVSGLSARARSVFRVVTSLSPPFVMESNLDEDGLCLRGLPCHRISTSVKHNMTLMFNSIETKERYEEDAVEHGNQIPLSEDHKSSEKSSYKTRCCYGLSMDLLDNVASELGFGYILYIVGDELFGSKEIRREDFLDNFDRNHHHQQQQTDSIYENQQHRNEDDRNDRKFNKKVHDHSVWNGIVGDLVVGTADMSFAPLSVSKSRSDAIDFSTPYFHSGVSLLAAPKVKTDIPLLAFLMPFSPELWIAIFIWLNLTAVAVAIYEWLSPFGLNPWGRMRSKNFSLSSALWVMWGLLCGHLVAFKAPKSWPNKFLINVWGGFSVIFIASYTANIAALIAGLFFQNSANTYDSSLMTQRVGIPRSSAAESYVQRNDRHLYERMKSYMFSSIEEGIKGLKNGSIDLLMADTPILDYYRGSDHGCQLRRIGENYIEDTYAIGMSKGFPLKDSISALIAKYSSNGYLDILMEKWYGGLPCYRDENHIEIVQPRPLGVAAVAGVYLMLGLGMVLGILILIFEHMFFKYYLPILRVQPKGSIWRSRNIMFFSQKLYRFINCVELVSPHHAARELVHTLRKGHITSLFQKSVKRKEDEQRRRRKSKAQFFEMIQEIRRVQQIEKEQPVIPTLAVVEEDEPQQPIDAIPSPNPEIQSIASTASSKPRSSPKIRIFSLKRDGHARSNSSTLNIRRFSTDSILGERLDTIGRRLSRDFTNDLTTSPPDLGAHRFETFGKSAATSSKFDTFSGKSGITKSADDLDRRGSSREKSKFDTFAGNLDEIKPDLPAKKNSMIKPKRKPLTMDVFDNGGLTNNFLNQSRERIIETYRETLHPPIFEHDTSKAILREKLHEELKEKYGAKKILRVKPPRVPSTVGRPLLRTHNPNDTFLQTTRSKETLIDVRSLPMSPRVPPPPVSFSDDDDDLQEDPTYATVLPKNKSNGIQLGRLSKEDLLDLCQKSESEISEFLNGKTPSDSRYPPLPP